VVLADGGKGSLCGKGMQTGRQDGQLMLKASWCGSKTCHGESLRQLRKHLQLKQQAWM
jgi:hypothetical protein